jgi:hypothetical protein
MITLLNQYPLNFRLKEFYQLVRQRQIQVVLELRYRNE